MSEAHATGRFGIRGVVTGALALLAVINIAGSLALVVMSTALHESGRVLRDSMAGARLTQGAEISLFLHERAQDSVVRLRLEGELRDSLRDARSHISTSAGRRLVDDATARVERYLAAGVASEERPELLQAAYGALERLERTNIAEADAALARSSRLDGIGNWLGLAGGLGSLALLGLLLRWIRRSVVLPTLSLSDAMRRFRGGDRRARAREDGAAELSQIGAQFNAMAADLEQAQRARLTYLAGVAHDLRNPLAALQMTTSLVRPDAPLPSEERVRHVMAIVRKQVVRLNRMVGDLLEAATIESGQFTLKMDEHDLRDIVQDAVQLFEDASPVHTIRVEMAEEPLWVRCDPLRIEQALNNLLSNAIKYSPRGGEVRIAAMRTDGRAALSVSDQGIGIAEGDLEALWQPFRRTGASTEVIPGVGLGLSVAKTLANAHGGEITVQSKLGVGSNFTIFLPLVDGTGAPRPGHG